MTVQPEPRGLVEEQRRMVERLERKLGADDPRTTAAEVRLAAVLRAAGELEAARTLSAAALAKTRELLGENHPEALVAASELGLTMLASGQLAEAERLLRFVYKTTLALVGPMDSATCAAATNLALVLRARGDIQEALDLQVESVHVLQQTLGNRDRATLRAETNLGSLLGASGRYEDAREAFEDVYALRQEELGPSHPSTLAAQANVGVVLRQSGDMEGARASLEEVHKQLAPMLGDEHPSTVGVAADLAVTLGQTGNPGDGKRAIQLADQVVSARTRELGAAHPQTLHARRFLARAAGKWDPGLARETVLEAARGSERVLGRGHVDTLSAYDEAAAILERQGEAASAEEMRTENASVREAAAPPMESLAGPLTAADEFTEGDFVQLPERLPLAERDSEIVTRTAHVTLDPEGEIELGERFTVIVFADRAEVLGGPGEGTISVRVPAGVQVLEVDVWLVTSRHFEIEGKAVEQLELDRSKDESSRARFTVRAAHPPDEFPEDPEVRVLFSYNSWPSGSVAVPVPMVAAEPQPA